MFLNFELLKKSGKVLFFSLFLFCSCDTRPDIQYAYATRALEAARAVNAPSDKCGARFYYNAEKEYKIGQRMLQKGSLPDANKQFSIAKELAEKAEEATIFCGK